MNCKENYHQSLNNMNKILLLSILCAVFFLSGSCVAQDLRKWEDIDTTGYYKRESKLEHGHLGQSGSKGILAISLHLSKALKDKK